MIYYIVINIVINDNHKLAYLLPPRVNVSRNMRNPRTFKIPRCKTDRYKNDLDIW